MAEQRGGGVLGDAQALAELVGRHRAVLDETAQRLGVECLPPALRLAHTGEAKHSACQAAAPTTTRTCAPPSEPAVPGFSSPRPLCQNLGQFHGAALPVSDRAMGECVQLDEA